MAKFAMIFSKLSDSKSIKAFQRKYSESNLKKYVKCDSVILLDTNLNSWESLEAKYKINASTLQTMSRWLLCADEDCLVGYINVNYSTRKFFIFSDDAVQSMFAFDCLSDDVHISAFELDGDSADKLVEKLECMRIAKYRVGQLYEAQDLCSSLSSIAEDCDLKILYRSAEEDIDEALIDAEEEFGNLKSDIQGVINSSWSSEVVI